LKLSLSALEFWEEFKETIYENFDELKNVEFIYSQFAELFKILLVQCKKLPGLDYQSMSNEDLEEEET
jgi:hypothetical protein